MPGKDGVVRPVRLRARKNRLERPILCVIQHLCPLPGATKKYSGLTRNDFQTNDAITLKSYALDRGKRNIDFDMLQLYFT